jgi:hypothetical protein
MRTRKQQLAVFLTFLILSLPVAGSEKKKARLQEKKAEAASAPAVLWRNPTDIASRNLFYGPGGKEHQPHTKFTFLKEDLNGSNPKFDVRDEDGVKWRVKLGLEARPETVATRIVWAVGYFANEDYFLRDLHVDDMPFRLQRGQKLVTPDGSMRNVRLKRYLKGEEKIGEWDWSEDPFVNTRELDGLKVMMALINNWDLKDENNSIYEEDEGRGPERIYMVSDLGASFGTPGLTWPLKRTRGNVGTYHNSEFITKVTPEYVDFRTPAAASPYFWFTPKEYALRLHLRWIGKHIPRDHARWMGQLLARLSPNQIRDAFRSAGYSPREVEGFSSVLEDRIAELSAL